MFLRRLSLLLVVACGLAFCWRGHQAVDACSRSAIPAVVIEDAAVKAIAVPSNTLPYSISPFAPWRYRLKSVLSESHSRIHQESDLGPLPLPGRSYSAVVPTPKSGPSWTVVPLRC